MKEQEAREAARDAAIQNAIQQFKDENLDNPKSALPTDIRIILTDGIRLGFDAGYNAAVKASAPSWVAIESAPKDGSAILLLSRPQTMDTGPNGTYHVPAKAAIGYWNPDGTSWVATDLCGEANVELQKTGVWCSGGGWFQPDEVTHWMPIPPYGEPNE